MNILSSSNPDHVIFLFPVTNSAQITQILNALVTHFLHSEHHHPHQSPELQQNVRQTHKRHHPSPPQPDDPPATTINSTTPARTTQMTSDSWIDTGHPHHEPQQQERLAQRLQEEPPSICCSSDDPVRDLEVLHQMAEILVVEQEQRERQKQAQQQERRQGKVTTTTGETLENKSNEMNDAPPTMDDTNNVNNNTSNTNENIEDGVESNAGSSSSTGSHEQHADDTAPAQDSNDRKLLMRMSMNTAIAIGLHNFPEGLATFVAALSDPQVGAVLAVAIAIHNIPEGLCVALPVYYATGSRRKAFGWAILSGLSEPLAAVFGYLILANAVTGTAYGILFGVVAGMMVMISTRELLPTAHRYDPTDRVVSYSFIFGMSILALSLVLFVL